MLQNDRHDGSTAERIESGRDNAIDGTRRSAILRRPAKPLCSCRTLTILQLPVTPRALFLTGLPVHYFMQNIGLTLVLNGHLRGGR